MSLESKDSSAGWQNLFWDLQAELENAEAISSQRNSLRKGTEMYGAWDLHRKTQKCI